jgi:hypothetical protein
MHRKVVVVVVVRQSWAMMLAIYPDADQLRAAIPMASRFIMHLAL